MFNITTMFARPVGESKYFVVAILTVLLAAAGLSAQVLISPTVIFVSEQSPTGRLIILNQSPHIQEITIAFSFGIPESDSLGNVTVKFQDSAVTDPNSALGWISAFPRSMLIKQDERQVVRLMVRPPQNLSDGEYWARVMISSQRNDTPILTIDKEKQIGTQLHMVTRQAIMFKYRKGDLTTQLDLDRAVASLKDSTVEVMLDMANLGNASYVGMLHAILKDRSGQEIDRFDLRLAVYRQLRRKIDLSLAGFDYNPPYSVELEISNDGRFDINPQDLIRGNKIAQTLTVE